ncbi:MAG: HK97 gp10 family phage protein [Candidatus Norongarragalinales archaeon]
MSITVAVSIDQKQVEEILEKCELFYPWFSGKFLRKSGERLAELMRERAPVRTGRLRQSITVRLETGKVTVGPTVSYAPYVEYGTKPHIIRPVHAKALAFEVGGTLVFAKLVHHPGFAGRFFARGAYEQFLSEASDYARELMEYYWRVKA